MAELLCDMDYIKAEYERAALSGSSSAPCFRISLRVGANADQLDQNGRIRIAHLSAPNRDAAATDALKGRARELQRLGLAKEVGRNVFQFKPDWQEDLKAMELHLDIRKSLMRERAQDLSRLQQAGQSSSRLLRSGPER